MRNPADPLTGAHEIAEDVFVFTSSAYAMNSGVVLPASGGGPAQAAVSSASSGLRSASRARREAASSARDGRRALLVDPGYFPGEIERIAAFLDGRDIAGGWVFLTHSDWDHVAGAFRWPDAAVVASAAYPARALSEGERIVRSLEEFDRRLYVRRDPPFRIPDAGVLAGSPSELVWDGPRARLFPARGHTADGLMLLLRDAGLLFAGDHLSDLEIPFVGDSFSEYRETLVRVRALAVSGEVDTLVPGHGRICDREEILARIEEDTDYLERLVAWVRETSRTVRTVEGLLDRADEVVFRKGWENPDVRTEHRSNVTRAARELGLA